MLSSPQGNDPEVYFQKGNELRRDWAGWFLCDQSHWYCQQLHWSLLSSMLQHLSVVTNSFHEISRHFQWTHHFKCHQRLRLETPGWRVPDIEGSPLTGDQLERQRKKIPCASSSCLRLRVPVSSKLVSGHTRKCWPPAPNVYEGFLLLLSMLNLDVSYELLERLWEHPVLTVSQLEMTAPWFRDEALVSAVFPPELWSIFC